MRDSLLSVSFDGLNANDRAWINERPHRKAAAALAHYYKDHVWTPHGHNFNATEDDMRGFAAKADAIKALNRGAILGAATVAGASCGSGHNTGGCYTTNAEMAIRNSSGPNELQGNLHGMFVSTQRVSTENAFIPGGMRYPFNQQLLGSLPWYEVPMASARSFPAPISSSGLGNLTYRDLFVAPFATSGATVGSDDDLGRVAPGMLAGITSLYLNIPDSIPSSILSKYSMSMDLMRKYLPRALPSNAVTDAELYFDARFNPTKAFNKVDKRYLPQFSSNSEFVTAMSDFDNACLSCHSTTSFTILGRDSGWGSLNLGSSVNCDSSSTSCAEFVNMVFNSEPDGDTATELTDFLGDFFSTSDASGKKLTASKPFDYRVGNVSLVQPSEILVSANRNIPLKQQLWGDVGIKSALRAMRGEIARKRLVISEFPLDQYGDPIIIATSNDLSDGSRETLVSTHGKLPVETGQITGHPNIQSSLTGLSTSRINSLAKLLHGFANDGVTVNLPNKSVTLLRRGCEAIEGAVVSPIEGMAGGEGFLMSCGRPSAYAYGESAYYDGSELSYNSLMSAGSPVWPTDSANLRCQKSTSQYQCSQVQGCSWLYPQNKCLVSGIDGGSSGGGDTGGGEDTGGGSQGGSGSGPTGGIGF